MAELFRKTGKQHRFGGDLVYCPVCKASEFTDSTVRQHITGTAKGEVWDKEFDPAIKTPHLDFYKKHTTSVRRRRVWVV